MLLHPVASEEKIVTNAVPRLANCPGGNRYQFYRCQPHDDLPNITGWYLELRPGDVETLEKIHRGVTAQYFFKYDRNPHIQADECYRAFYNPVTLAAKWLQCVERFLSAGEALLVNANGGFIPQDGVRILDYIESDSLRWPDPRDDEIITISRWPAGQHWYLSSNKHRVFCPSKYDSLDEALCEAHRYVPAVRVKTKECAGPLPPE